MCHTDMKLTAEELEKLFKQHKSDEGTKRRAEENLTSGFWSDYVMDCEGMQKWS